MEHSRDRDESVVVAVFKLKWLPWFVAGIGLFTTVCTLLVHSLRVQFEFLPLGHVAACALAPCPEERIFSLGMTVTAVLFFFMVVAEHLMLRVKLSTFSETGQLWKNRIATGFGVCCSVGIAGVANLTQYDQQQVHDSFAVLMLASFLIYDILVTTMARRVATRQRSFYIKAGISGLLTLATVAYVTVFAIYYFSNSGIEPSSDPLLLKLSAGYEYLTLLCLFAFSLAMYFELRLCTVPLAVAEVDDYYEALLTESNPPSGSRAINFTRGTAYGAAGAV